MALAAFRLFQEAAILTLYRHLTTVEHTHQNQMATSIDKLSQPTQALLRALYSVQPAHEWRLDDRKNTVVFTPTEVNYNSLRQ